MSTPYGQNRKISSPSFGQLPPTFLLYNFTQSTTSKTIPAFTVIKSQAMFTVFHR